MCDETAKVATDYAVPCCTFARIKLRPRLVCAMMRMEEDEADLFLDVLGDILVEAALARQLINTNILLVLLVYLFNVELVHRLRRCVN